VRDTNGSRMKDMIYQFFGSDILQNKESFINFLLWCPILFVEMYRGHFYLLLVLMTMFITYGATLFYRTAPGFVRYHYCCSSYSFWFVDGVSLVNGIWFLSTRSSLLNKKKICFSGFIVWSCVFVVLVKIEMDTFELPPMLHHAFPFLIGSMFVVLIEGILWERTNSVQNVLTCRDNNIT